MTLFSCAMSSDGVAFSHKGNSTAVIATACSQFPCSYYKNNFSGAAWLADITHFPTSLFQLSPQNTSGYSGTPSPNTLAGAAHAAGIPLFLGLFGWPQSFGADNGELAKAKAAGEYVIGSSAVDYQSTTSAQSVQSVLSLTTTDGAALNLLGYQGGDEPVCSGTMQGPDLVNVPTMVSTVHGYDATRLVFDNFLVDHGTLLPNYPSQTNCPTDFTNAGNALNVLSFDLYPMVNPYYQGTFSGSGGCAQAAHVEATDNISSPNDCIWAQGLGVQHLVSLWPNTPVWAFVDAGGDALASGGANVVAAQTTSGLKTVSNLSGSVNLHNSTVVFTSSWVNLNLTASGCIPANDNIDSVSGGIITLHTAATGNCSTNGSGTNTFTISGGTNDDCSVSLNFCVANGNEYRATSVQVNAEVWETIIAGGYGVEYFCDDNTSFSFCMGDPAGGAAATAALANITYIQTVLNTYAPEILQPHDGLVSMQKEDLTTLTTQTQGILTMATGTAACPGRAVANAYNGAEYLFVMTDRRSTSATNCGASTGATFTFTLTGKTGVATVIYDSNSQYDAANDTTNATHTLTTNAFTDTLGDQGDSYRVKIYKIQ